MDGKVYELLDQIAYENPRPEEKWFRNSDFDPPFTKTALRRAAETKRIELVMAGDDWEFRFTAKGRDDYEREDDRIRTTGRIIA